MTTVEASAYGPKWWSPDTVAVVTGANKGIGYEIAHHLGAEGLSVVLTARRDEAGQQAVTSLRQAVPDGRFEFCQCDVTKTDSIQRCAEFVKARYGGLDVLFNNAGIATKGDAFSADEAAATMDCNLKGMRRMTEALLPLLRQGGRIVNTCSMAGKLGQLTSNDLKEAFANVTDAGAVETLADAFVQAIRDGDYEQRGYAKSMYGMSKLACISYTLLLAKQLKDQGIMVNAICPGLVATDMTGDMGKKSGKTPAEGADTPVWVGLRPAEEFVTGKFFQDRKEIAWETAQPCQA